MHGHFHPLCTSLASGRRKTRKTGKFAGERKEHIRRHPSKLYIRRAIPWKRWYVNLELIRIVRRADDIVFTLGARSRAPEYLKSIEEAVANRNVTYHRLINAHHIPHELHEHLETLIDAPNVRISWTAKEKFSNLTVTENECVLVFPAPSSDKLSGLKLPSLANSQRYRRYFFEASEASITIETKIGIKSLCEFCSPDTARKPREIRRILLEEFEKSINEDDSEQ